MRVIHSPSLALWQRIAQVSPEATFFHTPTWAKIIIATYPQFKLASCAFKFMDGTYALLPAVASTERNRIFRWYESLYLGGYGGLISERQLSMDEITLIYSKVLNCRVANFNLIGNPLASYLDPTGFAKKPNYTHFIQLGNDYDLVSQGFKSDKKRSIKKASQLGVEITSAQTEIEYYQYFDIYQETIKRWGDKTLVKYEFDIFHNIFFQNSNDITLWLAKLNGEIICGKIIFYHRLGAFYWHGAISQKHLKTNVDSYLMAKIIADSCNRGLDFLDMGPSGGLAGVESYKERFGALKLTFNNYSWHNNKIYNLSRRIRKHVEM